MSSGISEQVQRFLGQHITSIEQLEVLLLLRRTEEREWNAAAVAREIGSSMMSMHDRLAGLASRGLLVAREDSEDILYRYAPTTDETRRTVDDLAKAYKERRLSIINLIYAKPPPSDIQSFSEAFRITKKGGEG
ncbi:uncharacterized protein SOCEGT47_070330 [Sorangium cellulosum]|uniref:HTH marR-type domain-containing protein n=1 Tax=Sorangium cellulosum TaxID=56 RepID=A0A4P2QA05_SORCE|nr:hypothetical protein [Sorangium cellulosum]AUX26464.1 uncharacterized protein SOCEGT47_070330 [Sorangium cellulosum]